MPRACDRAGAGRVTELAHSTAAAELLETAFGVKAQIWSCPRFNEPARDGQDAERLNRLNPEAAPRVPYLTSLLEGRQGLAIAATNYIRVYPEQIRAFVPTRYTVLGMDGFGRSDTREKLRRHFEVNRYYVAQAAAAAQAAEGKLAGSDVKRALEP